MGGNRSSLSKDEKQRDEESEIRVAVKPD